MSSVAASQTPSRVRSPTRSAVSLTRTGPIQSTGHTSRAIVVDDHLGTPAMYWGWIVAKNWELDYNERLPPWIDRAKEDFLLVVGVSQLQTARGLHDFVRGLPLVAKTRRYAIFDLRPRTA